MLQYRQLTAFYHGVPKENTVAIVQRTYIRHKSGGQQKVIELLKEGRKFFPSTTPIRYFAASIGPPAQTFQFEIEFPSFAAYEEQWAAANAHEDFPELMERWRTAVESIQSEIWEIKELFE
jgi:hypothetical protein